MMIFQLWKWIRLFLRFRKAQKALMMRLVHILMIIVVNRYII